MYIFFRSVNLGKEFTVQVFRVICIVFDFTSTLTNASFSNSLTCRSSVQGPLLAALPFGVSTSPAGEPVPMICHECPWTAPGTQWILSDYFVVPNFVKVTGFHQKIPPLIRSFLRRGQLLRPLIAPQFCKS